MVWLAGGIFPLPSPLGGHASSHLAYLNTTAQARTPVPSPLLLSWEDPGLTVSCMHCCTIECPYVFIVQNIFEDLENIHRFIVPDPSFIFFKGPGSITLLLYCMHSRCKWNYCKRNGNYYHIHRAANGKTATKCARGMNRELLKYSYDIKGIVQRDLTGVETRLKRSVLMN